MAKIRMLVVGCGSIGERHIRNLKSLLNIEVVACDVDGGRRANMETKYQIRAYGDLEEALGQEHLNAVVVATPPNLHISIARRAVESGLHLFMEKPISHNMTGVDELIRAAAEKKLIIGVGYNFRFHPGIGMIKRLLEKRTIGKVLWARAEVGQYLPEWRPARDYREVYTAHADMGGGIILDGSHEIDYLRWLVGEVSEVFCMAGKLSDLEVNAEDTAALLLKFENGAIGELHMDFVQRAYSRSCKIVGEEGTIVWDWGEKSVKIYTAKDGKWTSFPHAEFQPNDMYVEEMRHFLRCVRGEEKPLVDGEAGKRVLQIALVAKESARSGEMIRV